MTMIWSLGYISAWQQCSESPGLVKFAGVSLHEGESLWITSVISESPHAFTVLYQEQQLWGRCFRSAMWVPLAGNLCGRNLQLHSNQVLEWKPVADWEDSWQYRNYGVAIRFFLFFFFLKLGRVGHRMTFLLQLVVAEGPRTDFLLTSSGQNIASFLIPTNFYLFPFYSFLHFSLSLFSFFFPIG